MNKLALLLIGLSTGLGTCVATAAATEKAITVSMNAVSNQGIGKSIGNITITEVDGGLEFQPALVDVGKGLHGFHVHENPDCSAETKNGEKSAASAAGSHYDPKHHNTHSAPWEAGHLGDLPALYASKNKRANQAIYKPNLKLNDIKGRALIIHKNGDNYSDKPKSLGGGGARIACGIISK